MTECWEMGTCPFTSLDGSIKPLEAWLLPFDHIFGGLSLLIFWGLILGMLWLRTQNPQLVGIVGIAMSAAYLFNATNGGTKTLTEAGIPGMVNTGLAVGGTLLLISCGIAFYQIIINRLTAGPQ